MKNGSGDSVPPLPMTRRDVALESFQSWAHADFAEATRAVNAPALVIAPEHDARGTRERVADLLPNSRYVELCRIAATTRFSSAASDCAI